MSARSGADWSEVQVNPSSATSSVAVAFENGDSLLLLHNLLRADELACLNVEVATALRCKREARSSFTRFGPRHDTDAQTDMHRRHRVRIPSEQMPVTANILCDALLVRVLALLENQIPELATSLFGECLPCTTCIGNTNFEHSRGEPAINVYTELGCLGAHEDQHYLTVLIPLSNGMAADGESVHVHTGGGCLNGEVAFTGVMTCEPNQFVVS